jgi:hypothetical protein
MHKYWSLTVEDPTLYEFFGGRSLSNLLVEPVLPVVSSSTEVDHGALSACGKPHLEHRLLQLSPLASESVTRGACHVVVSGC